MIESLINFAKKLEKQFDIDEIPKAANEFLSDFKIDKSLSDFEIEIKNWLLENNIPRQVNLYNNFGEPSLTIFNNQKFAVDLYFWRKNDTIIHSHGFRGAFKVLYGLSLHEQFKVQLINSYASDIQETKLLIEETKVMSPGDVNIINPALTHRVVHLDNPTVTLCIRTVEDKKLDQWHHLPTGLSFKKKNLSEKTIKQVLYFQYLLESNIKVAGEFLNNILSKLDTSDKISLYESLCYSEIGLNEESFNFIENKYKEIFEKEEWFSLYKNYFSGLSSKLQELGADKKEFKLLAHLINCDYEKKQVREILKSVSSENLEDLLVNLSSQPGIFSDGHEEGQLQKINFYRD